MVSFEACPGYNYDQDTLNYPADIVEIFYDSESWTNRPGFLPGKPPGRKSLLKQLPG